MVSDNEEMVLMVLAGRGHLRRPDVSEEDSGLGQPQMPRVFGRVGTPL